LLPQRAWAVQNVANTVHNLSTSGPGAFKSLTIDQVCVFCHTPHAARPEAPLWNREMSGATYLEYGSTTLDAVPGQPTGKSRLCLACHDGTVALGAMVNPPTGPANDLASTFLAGRANLTTDLRDDHPISFPYDTALQSADQELANPSTINLPLEGSELQCTTCHDPHEETIVPFLHQTTLNGELCTTCHIRGGLTWDWTTSSHATSTATPVGANPWANRKPAWRGNNVAQNSCFNCHTPHNAAMPERLVKDQEEDTCFLCHNGTVASTDIEADFLKIYRHSVDVTPNLDHDATLVEDILTMTFHVECVDCHNPHGVRDAPPMISFNPANPSDTNHSTPPFANARIQGVTGVDVSGSPTTDIQFQYELCFKCHGLPARDVCDDGGFRCPTTRGRGMVRQDGIYNIRDKVNDGTPGLLSYHPIVNNRVQDPLDNGGLGPVPSLRTDIPLNTSTSLIYCTDCHSSDVSPAAGGVGPNGPHGSMWEGLLAQQYTLSSETAASPSLYELCYKCHSEVSLLNDESGFPHNRHIDRRRSPCVNCHDPHGSHESTRLINFLTMSNDQPGGLNIEPDRDNFGPVWIDDLQDPDRGECSLTCHGTGHDPRGY
jgi:predicted CXXCH cytochrome family protein